MFPLQFDPPEALFQGFRRGLADRKFSTAFIQPLLEPQLAKEVTYGQQSKHCGASDSSNVDSVSNWSDGAGSNKGFHFGL